MIRGAPAIRVVAQRVEATLSFRGINLAGMRRQLDPAAFLWRLPARMIRIGSLAREVELANARSTLAG